VFGRGSAPDPAGGAHDAPQTPTQLGRGTPPPHSPPPLRLQRLDSHAFGVRLGAFGASLPAFRHFFFHSLSSEYSVTIIIIIIIIIVIIIHAAFVIRLVPETSRCRHQSPHAVTTDQLKQSDPKYVLFLLYRTTEFVCCVRLNFREFERGIFTSFEYYLLVE